MSLSVRSEQPPRVWRVSDRLTDADVCSLVTRYQAGTPARELAEHFKISRTSVKRLLASGAYGGQFSACSWPSGQLPTPSVLGSAIARSCNSAWLV